MSDALKENILPPTLVPIPPSVNLVPLANVIRLISADTLETGPGKHASHAIVVLQHNNSVEGVDAGTKIYLHRNLFLGEVS